MNYARLYLAFVRYCLVREMAFRGNFLIRVATEALWFGLLLVFYDVVYLKTAGIGGWSKYQFLTLMGVHFVVTGTVETLFLMNLEALSDQIRRGDLDFALVKPVDEQFLLSLSKVDWSTVPNILIGAALVVFSLGRLDITPSLAQLALSALLVAAGVAIYYSCMLAAASAAIWMISNRGLLELWFYITNFGRYPREMYGQGWGRWLQRSLTFLIPVLLVNNLPAQALVRDLLDPWLAVYGLFSAAALLLASRYVFRRALRSYRSASS